VAQRDKFLRVAINFLQPQNLTRYAVFVAGQLLQLAEYSMSTR